MVHAKKTLNFVPCKMNPPPPPPTLDGILVHLQGTTIPPGYGILVHCSILLGFALNSSWYPLMR